MSGHAPGARAGGQARQALERVFREALAACAPDKLVFNRIEPRDGDRGFAMPVDRFDVKLAAPKKLWVFGAGKASLAMAKGLLAKLGEQVKGGGLIAPVGQAAPELLGPVQVLRGTHPHPGAESVAATQALVAEANRVPADDHVIFLLSGGASSLLAAPVEGLSVAAQAELLEKLMRAGAPITELNIVRKHLSTVKGGQLAEKFRCGVTVLVLSDVAGNALGTVGSGPCAPDSSTRAEALEVLKKYLGSDKSFGSLSAHLHETPKQASPNVRHVLIADGLSVARAAARIARARLPHAEVKLIEAPVSDEVSALASRYCSRLREELAAHESRLLVGFGEPVVRMPEGLRPGRGGRSTQLAALVAQGMKGEKGNWAFLAAGTDGLDGSSGAAGAVVDSATLRWAEAAKVGIKEAIASCDSVAVHEPSHGLIVTGPTGNNLQDLHFLLCLKTSLLAEIR